ncbi:Rieske family ferredoxin [Bradyrhizobium pachyrhizi]|uniref:non-heme iron oxygenase ferredoxin subunit n=1 Tax=Bradyrhizobium pachyrhizi TaxID=280333 RepID=UPI0007054DDC|nr:non-heme iron oxygenase ferredoxin subunit [Bradyrhizobium pachyrhizi]KRQ04960.1 Rieske family ferredoxin [Bradyrhizobium pachyrhizi]
MSTTWIRACAADDIDDEDVLGFVHSGQRYAIYNTPEGFFATDGICTHEVALLEDGLVIGTVIECPLHQGRFDIVSGKALSAPATCNLKTYLTKVEGGEVFIQICTTASETHRRLSVDELI